MRKAQTTVEYLLLMIITIFICGCFIAFWNRTSMTVNATGGVQDEHGTVHVPPMSE